MDSMRKTALVVGICYPITFISIPTLALYGPVKNHRDWILGSGGHTAVLLGGFLELTIALACIGAAVTLYPVIKRQNEGAALGFVAARVLEAGLIFTGVFSLLSLATLRQDLLGSRSSLTGLAVLPVIPVAAREFSLGVWLVVKGFRPSVSTTGMTAAARTPGGVARVLSAAAGRRPGR
jgi:hypothetical protein